MTDRPILFSGPMVRAILEGRKTQTRRVLREQPGEIDVPFQIDDGSWHVHSSRGTDMSPLSVPYAPGDRLYVRETWKPHSIYSEMQPKLIPESRIFYKADDTYAPSNTRWRPGIHMPRWASRITLHVTDVRVQRLQEISEEDARAEGALLPWTGSPGTTCDDTRSARSEFEALWNSLNGPRGFGWDANPWVIAVTFRPIIANIDSPAAHLETAA